MDGAEFLIWYNLQECNVFDLVACCGGVIMILREHTQI